MICCVLLKYTQVNQTLQQVLALFVEQLNELTACGTSTGDHLVVTAIKGTLHCIILSTQERGHWALHMGLNHPRRLEISATGLEPEKTCIG